MKKQQSSTTVKQTMKRLHECRAIALAMANNCQDIARRLDQPGQFEALKEQVEINRKQAMVDFTRFDLAIQAGSL